MDGVEAGIGRRELARVWRAQKRDCWGESGKKGALVEGRKK